MKDSTKPSDYFWLIVVIGFIVWTCLTEDKPTDTNKQEKTTTPVISEPTNIVNCKSPEMEAKYIQAVKDAMSKLQVTEDGRKYNNKLENTKFQIMTTKTGNYSNNYQKKRVCYAEVMAIPSPEQRIFLLETYYGHFRYADRLMYPVKFDQVVDKINGQYSLELRNPPVPDVQYSKVVERASFEEFKQARGL